MPPTCRLLAAAALLCGVAACGDAGEEGVRATSAPVTSDGGCPDDLVQGLAAWGAAGFSGVVTTEGGGSSCGVAVGMADRELDRPMSTASVFSIGSVSKTVVAAAVLQLAADGVVSLDDPAGTFLPTLGGPVAAAPIESLLLHTSGLVGSHGEDHEPLSREEAIDAIGALEVDPSVAGRFLYSNAGYTLLALVVEEATVGGYRRHLADRVLPEGAGFWDGAPEPVGDRAVGYADGQPTEQQGDFPGPHWALDGNGDVAMTAGQLARWTSDLFGGRTLDPAVGASMARPAVEHDGQATTIGWSRLDGELLGEPALASAGGGGAIGHDVVVVWLPESGKALVFASNGDRVTAEALAQAIGPAMAAGDPVPRPDAPVAVDAGTLAAAGGTYESEGGGRFEVRVDGDELVVVPSGGDALGTLLPTEGFAEEEVVAHEEAVAELLAGGTKAGAEEVAILEDDHGELSGVDLLGTTVESGELRTYVRLDAGTTSIEGWYALDDAGGIEAVDLSGPPSARLVAVAGGFRVDGRSGGEDAVRVTFVDDAMTVTGPDGTLRAERA